MNELIDNITIGILIFGAVIFPLYTFFSNKNYFGKAN